MPSEEKRKHKKHKSSDDEHDDRKKKKKDKKDKGPKLHQLVGYTNSDNPFGDHNLNQQFVWKKKLEKDGTKVDAKVSRQKKDEKDQHFYEEIQKVRSRRSEREAEQEEQERLRAEEARLREAEQYQDWHQKEEDFHLEQARVRSKIRLVEGREKPIDILAKNIILVHNEGEEEDVRKSKKKTDISSLQIELREPYSIFEGLELEELKELQQDIHTYQEMEHGKDDDGAANDMNDGANHAFWANLDIVCRHEIENASRNVDGGGKASTVHKAVLDEMIESFASKSSAELVSIQNDIYMKLDQNDGTLDVEFWDEVLEQLVVFKAKADLNDFHKQLLKKWLKIIEEKKLALQQHVASHPEEAVATASSSSSADANVSFDSSSTAASLMQAEKAKGMGDLEEEFGLNDEVNVNTGKNYWWEDKYRPRKPRYFNRVKTGYEWNKYNQTHYDHDNPPPKTVQGYKFSIFYPDLIDKTATPRYICEPADSKEFMILRFTAGAPYEDVAFKLVNREWEMGRKSGFRATFERGVMSLFFNFKRHYYRK